VPITALAHCRHDQITFASVEELLQRKERSLGLAQRPASLHGAAEALTPITAV